MTEDKRARAIAEHQQLPSARLILTRDLTDYAAALARAAATPMELQRRRDEPQRPLGESRENNWRHINHLFVRHGVGCLWQ